MKTYRRKGPFLKKQISSIFPEIKDFYYIFDDGKIYSEYSQKFLKSFLNRKTGYMEQVLVTKAKKTKKFLVHRLVLACFYPVKDFSLYEVNHIDGDKTNNILRNLEWATPKQNMEHASEHGLRHFCRGEQIGNSKLKEDDIREIFTLRSQGKKLQEIASLFGCSRSNIGYILKGKTWRGQGSTTIRLSE